MHVDDDPYLEQRLSRFEAQLDRFSLVIHQWQETQGNSQPADPRDLDDRVRTLEQTLDREALALRQMHEEPLRQLTDLSRSLEALVADLRVGAPSAVTPQSPAAPWPLDRVVHLHDELRRSANGDTVSSEQPARRETRALQPVLAAAASEAKQARARSVRVLKSAIGGEPDVPRAAEPLWRQPKSWFVAGGVMAAGLLVFGLAYWMETRLNDAAGRVAAAERQVTATTQQASLEAAAARQDAERQIAEARQLAQRAETVGAILTAPDLVRLNLAGAGADRSSAQLLWSRTRGLVLSGSRLPAAPPEATYQLWLMTGSEPVSAGLFVPDATGRASLIVDVPPRVIGPVVGASVTVEPRGGRRAPSGPTLLARLPSAPASVP